MITSQLACSMTRVLNGNFYFCPHICDIKNQNWIVLYMLSNS